MARLPLIAIALSILAVAGGVFAGMRASDAERSAKVLTVAEYMKKKGISPNEKFLREKLPKAEVVGPIEHNFGHLGHKESTTVEFKIKNSGGSDLRIDAGEVSCGLCVFIEMPRENLPVGVRPTPAVQGSLTAAPGATASVFVRFSQKEKNYEPEVSQTAKFRTSDPLNQIIEFRIAGKITKAYRLLADRISLGDVTVGSGMESRLGLFGYGVEPLKIEKLEFLSEVRDGQYAATIEPMPEEAVKAEEGATSGFNLVLTATQPPMGKIDHHLRLHIANAEPHTVDIPVSGNVVGKIQVVTAAGANPRVKWLANATYLDWSVVDGKVGDEVTLNIRAKAKPNDPPIEFKIKEIFPSDVIKAELGEMNRTEAFQIVPIKIRIPPGSKPANYRSLSVTSKPARIIIETSDPTTREIVIGLRFGIE